MGIFPFAGFWSKDEILSDTFAHEKYLYWIALVTAGITAFYMARVIFMTFFGEYRGGAPAEDEGHGHDEDAHAGEAAADGSVAAEGSAAAHHGPHESPKAMTLPLLVLAVPAIIAGFANIDKDIEHLLVGALPEGLEIEETVFRWNVAITSTIVPLLGIALAYVIYQAKVIPASLLERLFRPFHTLLVNRYYFDVLYERIIVGTLFMKGTGGAVETFDREVVDGAVNGLGRGLRQASSTLKYIQSGQFQTYGAVGFTGLLVAAVVVLILNPV
jgi:NADH:ubiquinone oxidoreductase subunit 5 (subunit L)/multisubunit Na+/H+ antiporter MnhA subunit